MADASLGGVTAAAVRYALDGLSLRQTVIASNMANGKAEGFRPMSIDFENQLAFELRKSASATSTADLGSMSAPRVRYGDPVQQMAGNQVSVDQAVLQMNNTVVKYQALIEGLNKYMSLTSMAIDGGRR